MITKFQNFKLIKESPDTIYYGENGSRQYYCEDKEARPFFIVPNKDHTKVEKIYIGGAGRYHGSINYYGNSHAKAYPGRVWIDSKVMTFWVYPNIELFKSIIETLEKELEIKMFNNGWRIEVLKSDEGIRRTEFEPGEDDYFSGGRRGEQELIPIEKYAGSEDVSEEQQIMHLMNWQEKELAKKLGKIHFPKGFGSDKTAWDSPNNIKWRQAKYQENKIYR